MTRSRLPALLAFLALTSAAPAADLVPLKLELPKAQFIGTPRPVTLPNLEQARAGARPDLLVPAGTVNLSKGRPVTSSDQIPMIGEASFVTDGEKSGTDGAYVELGPGVQWVQIDLGATAKIAAIVVWHFHTQLRAYHDVVVQVSNDKEFKTGVTTVFNNDDDNSAKLGKGADRPYLETNEGKLLDGKGALGRYVRLTSNGNTSDEMNHYCEVEVHGALAK